MYCTRNPMSSILSKIENFTQLKFEDIEIVFQNDKKRKLSTQEPFKKITLF